MPTEIRVDYFWFETNSGTTDDLIQALDQWSEGFDGTYIEGSFDSHEFRMSKIKWIKSAGRLSGVMYKKRPTNLPDELDDEGERTVDIGEDASIGDPVCFCYYPRKNAAAIQFNSVGARHSTLRKFLNRNFGIQDIIHTSPMFSDEAIERLENINIIRSLDLTLRNPRQIENLSEELGEGGLGGDIDNLLTNLGGVNISISISVGQDPKGSMDRGNVMGFIGSLLRKEEVCTKLQLKGRPGAGDEIEPLDLLNDTIKEYMEIPDMPSGRSIDTSRCLTKIHTAFTKLMNNG